ncbi:hypothetical protein BS78_04G228300 [Paspalum vaginatum]|nr:hypothetical protein BS78_04G228300 [Paspalum vaginatum]
MAVADMRRRGRIHGRHGAARRSVAVEAALDAGRRLDAARRLGGREEDAATPACLRRLAFRPTDFRVSPSHALLSRSLLPPVRSLLGCARLHAPRLPCSLSLPHRRPVAAVHVQAKAVRTQKPSGGGSDRRRLMWTRLLRRSRCSRSRSVPPRVGCSTLSGRARAPSPGRSCGAG